MDYLKQYRRFITSHYLTEGLRITFGIVLPAVIFSFFDLLSIGIAISLGAMCVTVTDTPGPIHHRRNGMLVCTAWITLVAIITGFSATSYLFTAILITVLCFLNCMIGIFGGRANSIGVAALVIMVLNIDHNFKGLAVIWQGLYIMAGGLWYTCLSLLLYGIRPYKLAQQALGELILETAAYLRIRAAFYGKEVDYDAVNRQMLEQQVIVERNQQQVNELLFRSRKLVKESTPMGRTLVVMYLDMVDLFEKTMTSFRDYRLLHTEFDGSGILQQYQQVIYALTAELEEIGIAVQANRVRKGNQLLLDSLEELKKEFISFRDAKRSAENLEGFISLRQILHSLEDITSRLATLHLYTSYDADSLRKETTDLDTGALILKEEQQVSWKLFRDNLSMDSNVFRHALRVSIATLAGYLVSRHLAFGHSYWILLTIIVILKPNYSLTKKRNYDRVIGTVIGALFGMAFLYFIKNQTALFVILLLMLVGTYSFVRTNYRIGVTFMTANVLLLFYLIYGGTIETILEDRLADTGIGSVIAFLANLLIIPAWEKEKIKDYMIVSLEKSSHYFQTVSGNFTGQPPDVQAYKIARRDVFVALANLSDAFNRMMAEPKFIQEKTRQVHQFVVLNNMLASHVATLAHYAKLFAAQPAAAGFAPLAQAALAQLDLAKNNMEEKPEPVTVLPDNPVIDTVNSRLNELFKKRQQEIKEGQLDTATRKDLVELKPLADQFNMISSIAKDLRKLSAEIAA